MAMNRNEGGDGANRNQFKLCTFIHSTEFKCDTNLHGRYIDMGMHTQTHKHTFTLTYRTQLNFSEYSEKAIICIYYIREKVDDYEHRILNRVCECAFMHITYSIRFAATL